MVILQFNKLIRNKWVWGVFAIAVSAAFCFDDLFTTRRNEERNIGEAGALAGEPVTQKDFSEVRSETLGLGRNRASDDDSCETNLKTWKRIAAEKVAQDAGIRVSDASLSEAIQGMFGRGGFDYNMYRMQLAQLGVTPEIFERGLRRDIAINRGVIEGLVGSGVFVSPMELDLAVSDMTDTYTVRVAHFRQTKEESDAVKVDEAALKAWYDKNVEKLALPELVKIKTVRYSAADTNVLARMTVTEDEMRDFYDASLDRYTSTDTNGVEVVKKFEEVSAEIEKELRKVAAVEYYTTNLQRRAFADLADGEDKMASRLDKIAKEDGLETKVSDWFSADGKFVEGFMVRRETICPGARDFADAVSELDPASPDFRYSVVASDNAVWLLEKIATRPAHTPSFAEAKGKIDARALRDAKADAFKAKVVAVREKGLDAVLASGDVSTNITFSVVDMRNGAFPDQNAVARAAAKLREGEISDFVSTGTGRGILVVCEKRENGDPAAQLNIRESLRRQLESSLVNDAAKRWEDVNLARLNLKPAPGYETAKPADEEDDSEESDSPEA